MGCALCMGTLKGLFSTIDMPFLGCVLCTGAHYTRKKTVIYVYFQLKGFVGCAFVLTTILICVRINKLILPYHIIQIVKILSAIINISEANPFNMVVWNN